MVFVEIFDEPQKFSLLIDRCHAIDIIMEAKSLRFSQLFHKSYQTVKLFSHLTFVVYGIPIIHSLHHSLYNIYNYTTLPKIPVISIPLEISYCNVGRSPSLAASFIITFSSYRNISSCHPYKDWIAIILNAVGQVGR